jgi:hypothetical protein
MLRFIEKNILVAISIGTIEVNPVWDLEQVRALINKFIEDSKEHQKMFPEWCFLDCECQS